MKIREIVHKLHLVLGIGSGVIVVVVALTGCVWAFEEEIRYLTQREQLFVSPQAAPRTSASRVMAAVNKAEPATKLNQIRLFGEPGRAVQVFTADKRMLTANPYTGQLIANRNLETDWLLINLKLHRTLLLGETGKRIIYWNTWIFLVMLVSGFVLWLPARWRQLRSAFTVKWRAKSAKRIYDLHSVLGFYAIPGLLLIAVTGLDMASHGDKKKGKKVVYAKLASATVVDAAVSSMLKTDAFETVRINLPKDSLNPLRVVITYPTTGLRRESTFTFDPASARLLDAKQYQATRLPARFWGSDYELHTGRILGLWGKSWAFLMGLIAASLPITGFLFWRGKHRRIKKPRKRVSVTLNTQAT
ncbi:PepSY-associated TM helix domain-containing protein [Fibrella arboris]|uniref:PepSY-associated TM helix domain-containing protein n=1 Tax=Fibrella arboris TaxID=3242486 RepID=UPI0035229F70